VSINTTDQIFTNLVATSGDYLHPVSPFPGQQIQQVPQSSVDDVKVAVNTARAASETWAKTDIRDRLEIFENYYDLLFKNQDLLLDVIQLETGKARAHAAAEIFGVAMITSHYLKTAKQALKPNRRSGIFPVLSKTKVLAKPKGVVGIISPWNYPLTLSIYDAIPAMIAGNTVVIRPDQQTAWSAIHAVDLLHQAGLPKGVATLVIGDGPKLGSALIDEVDYICFTGSTATGKKVGAQAGGRLIGASLELGGKNPMIVDQDADLNTFIESAVQGCFTSAGQLCVSIERMFIHEKIYDEFLTAFVERVKTISLGAQLGWEYEVGSLGSVAVIDRVDQAVQTAIAEGAKALTGAKRRPDIGPYVYEPTVLTGVTREMKIYREEVFGPVVYVLPFKTTEEAISLANDSQYGLSGSVISKNLKSAEYIASQIKCGSVSVNDGFAAAFGSVSSPMGGVGQSGLGRRHGIEGLLRFTEAQTLAVHPMFLTGPKFGLSEQRWNTLMTKAIRLLKRLGIR
jgi:succinate-semialdehyde dehydrogenase/glutarate-semialdehyde dehydrogenase